MKAKLIVVSFRLPYRFSNVKGKLQTQPSVGGLATALKSFFANGRRPGNLDSLYWIGISDLSRKIFDKLNPEPTVSRDNIVMHPVFLPPSINDKFYNGFCNAVIWPLFHYFPSFVVHDKTFLDEYVHANQLICDEVLRVYEPGDLIWVHDYHLMVLPSLLRQKLPDASIAYFHHIPFPHLELLRSLSNRSRRILLDGLLGADLVGFQTKDYTRYYTDAIRRFMPEYYLDNNTVEVADRVSVAGTFPISIDYELIEATSKSLQVQREVARIRTRFENTKLVLSVDRLDYAKAIFSRLESFELLLKQHPELKGRVSYVLLMVPTRESIHRYKENKKEVEALISRINGIHSTLTWTPIIYQYHSTDFTKLIALYSACDIAMVVPSRDGMNLVAKEYVATRVNGDGVLILSETAGAANELTSAVLVAANDRQEVADALFMALEMEPHEQRTRMKKMQDHIREHNVVQWADTFLKAIDEIKESQPANHDRG